MGLDMYELPKVSLNARLTLITYQNDVPKDCIKHDSNIDKRVCAKFALSETSWNNSGRIFASPYTDYAQINIIELYIRNKAIIYKWIKKFNTYKMSEENKTQQVQVIKNSNIIPSTKDIFSENIQRQNTNNLNASNLGNLFGTIPNISNNISNNVMDIQEEPKGPVLEQICAFVKNINQFIQYPHKFDDIYDSKFQEWKSSQENNAIDQSAKDTISDAIAEVQNEFWHKKITKPSAICKACFQKKHLDASECKRKCRFCRHNHTKFCINKIHCPMCGKLRGNHTCDEEAWKNVYLTKIKCPLCGLNGHFGVQCNALYMAISSVLKQKRRRNKTRTGFKYKIKPKRNTKGNVKKNNN